MIAIGEQKPFGGSKRTIDVPKLMLQHLLWVIKARLALDGRLSAEAKSLGDHTKCDLGKWMGSNEAESLRSQASYKEFDEAHKRLHALANDIISSAEGSAAEENDRHFGQLLETSRMIMGYLEKVLPR